MVLGPEEAGDLGHPALDGPVGGGEEVRVPAGGVDAGAVAGAAGEPAVGPGDPGRPGPHLGQALEEGPVGGDGGAQGERGDVPGAADDGDGVPELLARRAQPEPHVRLADEVAGVAAVPVRLAQGAHGLGEGPERGGGVAVAAQLDDVLPPALGVLVPGGPGEFRDGIDPRPVPGDALLAVVPGGVGGEGVRGGQVEEADGGAPVQGPADRDPFGRELGHRPERGPAGVVHGVGEQRDGRPHVRVRRELHQRVGLGGPLDQHRGGPLRLQDGPHPPRGPGPVVPHPEQQGPTGVHARAPGDGRGRGGGRGRDGGRGEGRGRSHALTSRQAR